MLRHGRATWNQIPPVYTHLRGRFNPAAEDEDSDPAAVEAAWDAELESRVSDIKGGKVELVSGEEFERRTAALFNELGINRQPRAVQGSWGGARGPVLLQQ